MVNKMVGHFRGAQNLGNEKAIFSYILDKMEEAGMYPPISDSSSQGAPLRDCLEWDYEDEM